MTAAPRRALEPAPASVIDATTGGARFGRWAGAPAVVSWDGLAEARRLGRARRLFCEKRWRWVMAADDGLLVSAAIADLGYMGLAVAYVLDRRSGGVLADVGGLTAPPLVHVGDETWRGARCRWRGRGGQMSFTSAPGEASLLVDLSFGAALGAALRFDPPGAAGAAG